MLGNPGPPAGPSGGAAAWFQLVPPAESGSMWADPCRCWSPGWQDFVPAGNEASGSVLVSAGGSSFSPSSAAANKSAETILKVDKNVDSVKIRSLYLQIWNLSQSPNLGFAFSRNLKNEEVSWRKGRRKTGGINQSLVGRWKNSSQNLHQTFCHLLQNPESNLEFSKITEQIPTTRSETLTVTKL